MPAGQVDELLNIIAAMQATSGEEAAFTSHKDLYDTIDATKLGDTPWNHFNLSYQGKKGDSPLKWQTEDFTIWFRNPWMVIHNLLSNPDFNNGLIMHHSRSMTKTETINMRISCWETGAGGKWYVLYT